VQWVSPRRMKKHQNVHGFWEDDEGENLRLRPSHYEGGDLCFESLQLLSNWNPGRGLPERPVRTAYDLDYRGSFSSLREDGGESRWARLSHKGFQQRNDGGAKNVNNPVLLPRGSGSW